MTNIRDFSLAKLEAKIKEAEKQGNNVEAKALGLLKRGIEEGVWSVFWDRGEPVFAMADENLEEAKADWSEKD